MELCAVCVLMLLSFEVGRVLFLVFIWYVYITFFISVDVSLYDIVLSNIMIWWNVCSKYKWGIWRLPMWYFPYLISDGQCLLYPIFAIMNCSYLFVFSSSIFHLYNTRVVDNLFLTWIWLVVLYMLCVVLLMISVYYMQICCILFEVLLLIRLCNCWVKLWCLHIYMLCCFVVLLVFLGLSCCLLTLFFFVYFISHCWYTVFS